jgi:hypothetical protein
MLNKEVVIDKIEALESRFVQVRKVTRIIEDGVELSRSYHRWALAPGQNIADQDPRVQAICNAVWTPEVVAAYQAQRQAALQQIGQ